jgi:hypothetical protein
VIIPSRAFQKRRRRVRWAGERLLWWRDPMSDLPPPLNEDAESRERRK